MILVVAGDESAPEGWQVRSLGQIAAVTARMRWGTSGVSQAC